MPYVTLNTNLVLNIFKMLNKYNKIKVTKKNYTKITYR